MTLKHPTWSMPAGEGELIMMPCPGTKDVDLESTVSQLKAQGVTAILSMMAEEEMERLDAAHLPDVCKQNHIQWYNLETGDHKTPDSEALAKWEQYKGKLVEVIRQGGKIAVHCKGGTGRTGVGTAMILLELGWTADQAIADVKALKPGAFAHELTVAFIKDRAETLKESA